MYRGSVFPLESGKVHDKFVELIPSRSRFSFAAIGCQYSRVTMGLVLKDRRPRRVSMTSLNQRRYRSFAFFLLFLAGMFSLRGWRAATMIEDGKWTENETKIMCEWDVSRPLLYSLGDKLQHRKGGEFTTLVLLLFVRNGAID